MKTMLLPSLHRSAPPPEYFRLSDAEVLSRIATAREKLGRDLLILGHHYQQDDIIRFADKTGDSYGLAKQALAEKARFIVFCGVHFMAETADILTEDRQIVILPDHKAGCSMADMADLPNVEVAWEELMGVLGSGDPASGKGAGDSDPLDKPEAASDVRRPTSDAWIIPITYVNSAADLKAFCGRHNGAVCTSSNARPIIEDVLGRGAKLFFFPDQHLGRNTCYALGIPLEKMIVWDPQKELGGNTKEAIRQARVILWKGHCSVHQGFHPNHIDHWRKQDPQIRILVHPECSFEVVQKADLCGSTSFIVRTVTEAPASSRWAVGTEIHLVNRLKNRFPDRFITSLSPFQCLCETMYRIRPPYLLWSLENLLEGRVINQVKVPPEVAQGAKVALERMLELAG